MFKINNETIKNYFIDYLIQNNNYSTLIEFEKENINNNDLHSIYELIIKGEYEELLDLLQYENDIIIFEVYKLYILDLLNQKQHDENLIIELMKIIKFKIKDENAKFEIINFLNYSDIRKIEGYSDWTINKGKYLLIMIIKENLSEVICEPFKNIDLWNIIEKNIKNKKINKIIKNNLNEIEFYFEININNNEYNKTENKENHISTYKEVWTSNIEENNKFNDFIELFNVQEDLPIRCVTFSPDGEYFAIGNNNKNINIGSINKIIKEEEDNITEFKRIHNGPIYSLDWSNNGKILGSGSMDKSIKLNILKGNDNILIEDSYNLQGHNGVVRSITFSKDDEKLYSGGLDDKIIIWDTNKIIKESVLKGNISQVYNLQIHSKKNILGSVGGDNEIQIWDTRSNNKEISFNTENYDLINYINFHSNKKNNLYQSNLSNIKSINENLFFTAHQGGCIYEWDLRQNDNYINIINIHNKDCRSVEIDPTNKYLLTSSFDNTCKIYDYKNNNVIQTLNHHKDRVVSSIWHPFLPIILTSSADCKASILISKKLLKKDNF